MIWETLNLTTFKANDNGFWNIVKVSLQSLFCVCLTICMERLGNFRFTTLIHPEGAREGYSRHGSRFLRSLSLTSAAP